MLKGYKIITVTHKQTNLSQLCNFVISTNDTAELKSKLSYLKEKFGWDELMYLATCNRVMYFIYSEKDLPQTFIQHLFQSTNPDFSTTKVNIQDSVSYYEGEKAIRHLLEVSASIDSMVVGEREILRQLRAAYEQCQDWGFTGDNIRLVMRYTIEAAKKVYATTKIGEKQVSIVSLAIQQLMNFQQPQSARFVLVGAGQTNQLVMKFLVKHGCENVTIFNRSLEKAQELATLAKNAKALPLEDLENYREGFDTLIVCTWATEEIITPVVYKKLLNGDKSHKVVIDLAIPYNVSPQVATEFNASLIEIEQLRTLAQENLAFRTQQVESARTLLNTQLDEFHSLFQQRRIERAMQQVPSEIRAIKEKALNEVFRKDLDKMDDETRALVEKMMTYMEKKCIGIPMKAAKSVIQ